MIVLSLDYGDRYVGAAITDGEGRIALRYEVIDQKKVEVLKAVENVVVKERVEKVLVGVPMGRAGNETEQTHKTLAFIEELRERLGDKAEIEGVDEVFTSKEARRMLRVEGKGVHDEHMEAARIMLEDYLRNPNFKISRRSGNPPRRDKIQNKFYIV